MVKLIKVATCDRCGAKLEEDITTKLRAYPEKVEIPDGIKRPDGWELLKMFKGERSNTMMLCGECSQELHDFLDKGDNK